MGKPSCKTLFSFVALFCFSILFAVSGCGGGSASATTYATTIANGRAAVKDIMDETGASSVSLALVEGNNVVWTESFGLADRAANKVPNAETMYGIASVSKMFAAISAMILVDKGKISLDEPVVTYLPSFSMTSPQYRDITVRMLLNHSSGFPGTDYRNAETAVPFHGYAAQVMEGLKTQRLKHTPGYMNVYCNDGFTMVENLVSAVSGKSYPEFVQQEILAPLEMRNSRYATETLLDGSYAKSYTGETPNINPYFAVYASGGLYTTPTDMAHLASMLMNGGVYGTKRILSEGAIAAMGQDQTLGSFNPLPSDDFRYGLGWDSVTDPGFKAVGVRAWHKGGDITGYGATFIVAQDERLAVAVMGATNIGSDKANKIAEIILLNALVERGRIPAMPKPLENKPLPVIAPSSVEKSTISGYYATSDNLFKLTFANDDSLTVAYYKNGKWGALKQGLKLRSDGLYASDTDAITAVRMVSQDGRSYFAMRLLSGAGHYSTTTLYGQRLLDKPPLSTAWQSRISETWLPVNDYGYTSYLEAVTKVRFSLYVVDALPGYLVAGTKNQIDMVPQSNNQMDGLFLLIPQLNGRDLADLYIERWENQEWLRSVSTLYRPLSGVTPIAAGQSSVTIGSNGFAEWRKLPASGSVSIAGASMWRLFDADFTNTSSGSSNGSVTLSGLGAAAYLLLFGTPGTVVSLNLSP